MRALPPALTHAATNSSAGTEQSSPAEMARAAVGVTAQASSQMSQTLAASQGTARGGSAAASASVLPCCQINRPQHRHEAVATPVSTRL